MRPNVRTALSITLGAVVAVVLAGVIAFQVSPWPGVLVIRGSGSDGLDTADASAQYVPDDIAEQLDQHYAPGSPDHHLDVFRPTGATEPLPTIVWIHGGAFVAGVKEAVRPYLKVLASHGYVTVNLEYTTAPEAQYPTQTGQVGLALDHLVDNAEAYGIDPDQLVLAGDSAGAHIAAQTALAIHDRGYAEAAELPVPAVGADQLRATLLLYSGPYDLNAVDPDDATFGWFIRTVLWAYTGVKDFRGDPRIARASVVDQDLSSFPPSFVSTGPYDPLLPHSITLVERLTAAGVRAESTFFDREQTPEPIGHEYALALETPQARTAMKAQVAFLRDVLTGPARHGVSDDW